MFCAWPGRGCFEVFWSLASDVPQSGNGQVTVKPEAIVFLAVDEAIDRLGADADQADAIGEQPALNMLRQPVGLRPFST